MEDTALIYRGSSVLDFNKHYNFHTEPLSNTTSGEKQSKSKQNKNKTPKLNKINSLKK